LLRPLAAPALLMRQGKTMRRMLAITVRVVPVLGAEQAGARGFLRSPDQMAALIIA